MIFCKIILCVKLCCERRRRERRAVRERRKRMDQIIVITGMGAVTPIGIGVETYWNNLVAGVSGIAPIAQCDTSALTVKVAAEVKGFDAAALLPKGLPRETVPFMQFGYAAAQEALVMSGLDPAAEPRRVGVTLGTALAGVTHIAETQHEVDESGKLRVSPRFVPKALGNIAAAQVAIHFGIQGPSFTVQTTCSSGGDAIGLAAMLLKAGEADAMVAVGAESSICPVVLAGLASARALSRNDDPETACRPFDLHRDGFVMGEGGGALVLETLSHAQARGAKILGVLCGTANNTDGHHVTAPHPDGIGAIACMEDALRRAGLSPADIGYINTHGTSTPMGDAIEAAAVKKVFGDNPPPVSSTKGATGHMMGAGGITEVIACVKAVETGILPPTLHVATPDPACDLDVIPNEARNAHIRYAMSNAFGFGGQNSSVIVGRYE